MSAVGWSRIQFAFTVTYHYLFPQLTMGLALLLVVFKLLALRSGDAVWNDLARFWGRIFAVNFGAGVVTGIPLEFQFGTNWGRFSSATGGVVGLTLAMEGAFAFFAESVFLGFFLLGEKKLSPRAHLASMGMVFLGSWLSGYFIVVTNAFMQNPVGYALSADGQFAVASAGRYLFNAWAFWEYAHTMTAAVITGACVVASVAAYWALMGIHPRHARGALEVAVIAGFVVCVLQAFPTGDQQGKLVADRQPATLAAMEGKFDTGDRADLAIIGQPNVAERRLENPIVVPRLLSLLAYGSFGASVVGLNDIPRQDWPDNVELLYFAYHIMVGLGTLLLALLALAAFLLWRGSLMRARAVLWALLLAFPLPYIATTAGWMTAELGRQPWLVYGLLRTAKGASPGLGAGDVVFTTIGFCGLYATLGVLVLALVGKQLARGPEPHAGAT